MIKHSKKTQLIIIFPQNIPHNYCYDGSSYKKIPLKNNLELLSKIVQNCLLNIDMGSLVYEKTETIINGNKIPAAFYFPQGYPYSILTKSNKSDKPTTIEIFDYILTTLDLPHTPEGIFDFLAGIGLMGQKQAVPEWFKTIEKFDDKEQKTAIEEKSQKIKKLESEIEAAQQKLEENDLHKSILYTNGNELVIEVFRILEEVLKCDLSEFIDKKSEDFEIVKEDITFIGEIKGVTSNVRNVYISQLDVHVQGLWGKIKRQREEKVIKGLLIINSQLKQPPETRNEIGQKQIGLAVRNGSLIIATVQLLDLYEKYKNGQITSGEIIKQFSELTGSYK